MFFPAAAFSQRVSTFDLGDVRLNESPFKKAQETDLRYILALDVDRLLVPFVREAGLPLKTSSYGNWESTGLDGHIGGHYLSAVSLMLASTGDQELKQRLEYMVATLSRCQQANGNGYVGGIPGGKAMWEEIRRGEIRADNFSLNGKWVPLYNIHKLYAGLYDAYVIGKNELARTVFVSLCNWFYDLTVNLSDDQIQAMLKSEHGGLNEVFAQAGEMTGDRKFLVLARKLSHNAVLRPLMRATDSLTGLHANTQIPKVIGFMKVGDVSNDTALIAGARFFWETVVNNRTVSIGGNSVREHFHPADDFSSMIESNQGPETCNTYNMLKLTKALYQQSTDLKYIDYYERAMYNHILSSQHPARGGFVYFTPMRPFHYRVYSGVHQSFWCCVGSGLENHGKYGELIYAYSGRDLFVNLFVPSSLSWSEKGINIHQETDFPYEEKSKITLTLRKPSRFTVNVRCPAWSRSFRVEVNGVAVQQTLKPSSYVQINRQWKSGDVIEIWLPMETKAEYLPDGSAWVSFVHGPLVLAAATDSSNLDGLVANDSRMGHVAEGKFFPVDDAPMIIKRKTNFAQDIRPVPGKPLTFSLDALVYPAQYSGLELTPFYSIHDKRYIIYWPSASPAELENIKKVLAAKEASSAAFRARIVDEVIFGEQQPEVEHRLRSASAETGTSGGKSWRSTTEWLSCEMVDQQSEARVLQIITISGSNRKFDILLNNQLLKTIKPDDSWDDKAVTHEIEIPESFGKLREAKLTILIKAHPGSTTGRLHSLKLLR
jgi:DUF1680 family protein